jgi:hypothetical protein
VEDNMNWIIQSKDRSITDIKYYATEDAFRAALKRLFSDPKEQFISATLPDGTVLDEAEAKELAGFTIGESGIGQGSGIGPLR